MAKSSAIREFFRLAFQPVPKWWGWVTVGVPALATIIVWSLHYGLWATGIFLVSLVILLAVAGLRLQRRVNAQQRTRESVEALARFLDEARLVQSAIFTATVFAYTDELADRWPDPDSESAKFGDIAKAKEKEWQQETEAFLAGLGAEYVSLFRSQSGLPKIEPPAEWFTKVGWADAWERVHHRCIRLEEFIKEIPREG